MWSRSVHYTCMEKGICRRCCAKKMANIAIGPSKRNFIFLLPERNVVAISGDFDFQFLIEELAVGAQFNIPYIHVLVNNAYLGLIRQSQRAFDMDYCVQLAFENINSSEVNGYGVDHVKVAEGLGCKAIRVFKPEDIAPAFEQAKILMAQYRVPVVVEVILERVTNISMGSELDNVMEFEDIADNAADAPTETCFMHYE
ncbi:thiamine pyrophosphate-dependent enzyme [Escherichia coli]|uniref:thiamine pyrophosphate-dependent enzyme n=1 Tax=Escherichia coli TaxID=562 RepID=UPI002B26F94A|nr:thiamine pyrophosphate-dependent enzyme [Escherichia coli]